MQICAFRFQVDANQVVTRVQNSQASTDLHWMLLLRNVTSDCTITEGTHPSILGQMPLLSHPIKILMVDGIPPNAGHICEALLSRDQLGGHFDV